MDSAGDTAAIGNDAINQHSRLSALIDENRELKWLLQEQTDLSRGYLQQCKVFEEQRLIAVEQNEMLRSSIRRLDESSRDFVIHRTPVMVSHEYGFPDDNNVSSPQPLSSGLSSPGPIPDDNAIFAEDASARGFEASKPQVGTEKRAHGDHHTCGDDDTIAATFLQPINHSRDNFLVGSTVLSQVDNQIDETGQQAQTKEGKGTRPAMERLRDRVLQNPGWGAQALQHAFFTEQEHNAWEWNDTKRTTLITLVKNYESSFQDVLTAISRHMLLRIAQGPHFEPWITTTDIRAVIDLLGAGKPIGKRAITVDEMRGAEQALRTRTTIEYFDAEATVHFDSSSGCVRVCTRNAKNNQPQTDAMAGRDQGEKGIQTQRQTRAAAAEGKRNDLNPNTARRSTRVVKANAQLRQPLDIFEDEDDQE